MASYLSSSVDDLPIRAGICIAGIILEYILIFCQAHKRPDLGRCLAYYGSNVLPCGQPRFLSINKIEKPNIVVGFF
jgi:hypothetical protein